MSILTYFFRNPSEALRPGIPAKPIGHCYPFFSSSFVASDNWIWVNLWCFCCTNCFRPFLLLLHGTMEVAFWGDHVFNLALSLTLEVLSAHQGIGIMYYEIVNVP